MVSAFTVLVTDILTVTLGCQLVDGEACPHLHPRVWRGHPGNERMPFPGHPKMPGFPLCLLTKWGTTEKLPVSSRRYTWIHLEQESFPPEDAEPL